MALTPRTRDRRHRVRRRGGKWLGLCLAGLIFGVGQRGLSLVEASRQPVDATLMLGGSIRREIHAAQLAQSYPGRPILISGGSDAPCIWLIFERELAPKSRVWLEPCARSTLDNYRFSLPTLQRWGARHVQLVTSGNHQRRALGLGRIILGSHGIWLTPAAAPEDGRPGNREFGLKTGLDWLRGMGWALVSQVYRPHCEGMQRLDQVEPRDWVGREFSCEAQGQVEIPDHWRRSP